MALSITDESERALFFVFDVSNGDTRFLLLLLLIERVSNVISETWIFLMFLDLIVLKKKEN